MVDWKKGRFANWNELIIMAANIHFTVYTLKKKIIIYFLFKAKQKKNQNKYSIE